MSWQSAISNGAGLVALGAYMWLERRYRAENRALGARMGRALENNLTMRQQWWVDQWTTDVPGVDVEALIHHARTDMNRDPRRTYEPPRR